MCHPDECKWKKATWLSVERAQELGLGGLDPRVRGPHGGAGSQQTFDGPGGDNEVVCLDSEGEEG